MEKRYQVFVSSTFADLQDERQAIMQAVMQMDCIPAGMELFPAADEEQMQFIKKIIDDSDYYLLLIGGRYGSVSADGVSYTEQEYEYAKSKGMKVIALLHKDPESLPVAKSEKDPIGAEKLKKFRAEVSTGRLVNFWNTAQELPGLVALSLMKTIKAYPAVGWVRGNTVASEDLLRQINDLRQENEKLRTGAQVPQTQIDVRTLADLDEHFEIKGSYWDFDLGETINWSQKLTWRKIFWMLLPYANQASSITSLKEKLENSIRDMFYKTGASYSIEDQIFQSIFIQMRALNLISANGELNLSGEKKYTLTPSGDELMFQLRAIKLSPNS
ncbi:DUF4062 domain-containing protein [Comamonas testosteroni]|uniref:DUF4062 domain-containing protein n=1 Tax=Comamonas testosteroni TaxID=285 RepID=UPI0009BC3F57|nr:DUF4062 domain-containing protein [Comamonas testosteroni]